MKQANQSQSETTKLEEFSLWGKLHGRGFDLTKEYALPIHTRARLFQFKQGKSTILILIKAQSADADEAEKRFLKIVRTFEPLLSKIRIIKR